MKLLLLCPLFAGMLLTALSIPMALGKVPRNGWYGFRTPKSMSTPELWSKANVYSGKALTVAGVVTSLLALVLWCVALCCPISRDCLAWVSMVSISLPIFVAVVMSFLYLRKL